MRQIPNPKNGKYTGDQRITAAEYALSAMASSIEEETLVSKAVDKMRNIVLKFKSSQKK
jgi:hypothetical protein